MMSDPIARGVRGSRAPFEDAVTFFYVQDLERTARFWSEMIGLALALDQGSCLIYRISPGGYVGFCQRQNDASPEAPGAELPSKGPAGDVILTLVTRDVDAWAADLRARGVLLVSEPRRNARFDIYHFFLRDPDGLLVEIQRFEDPGWRYGAEA